MTSSDVSTGDYVQLMISCQSRLYAFILSLMGDPDQANDVLQETNIVLWKKSDQFKLGTNFMAWVFKIARFQVMAYRQKKGRDRHVFDDDAITCVADAFEELANDPDDEIIALSHCLNELQEEGRDLIEQRYKEGISVKLIAEQVGATANHVAVRLHRLRMALLKCIRKRGLGGEPA